MTNSISGSGFNSVSMSEMREKMFKKMDSNGDGKIDKSEMQTFQAEEQKATGRTGPDIDKIFADVDTDKDGAISKAEDEAQFEKMKEAMKNGPRGMGGKPPIGPPPMQGAGGAGATEESDDEDSETTTAKKILKMLKELEKTIAAKVDAAGKTSNSEVAGSVSDTAAADAGGTAGVSSAGTNDSTMKTLLDMIKKIETATTSQTQKAADGTNAQGQSRDLNYVIKSAISAYMQNNSIDPKSFSGTINIQISSMYA